MTTTAAATTATLADSLVSEMAQKFNDALDGVDPIDLNDDKTLKWRGLLNNKFAAASSRRGKKLSDSEPGPSVDAADRDVADNMDGGDDADDDRPKRVLRRKAKTEVLLEKKATRASKSMSKESRDEEAGVVESESEAAVAPKRKGRPAKRNSDAQVGELIEPKALRTRRSDRQMSTRHASVEQQNRSKGEADEDEEDVDDEDAKEALVRPKSEVIESNSEPEPPKTESGAKDDQNDESVILVEEKMQVIDVDAEDEPKPNGDTIKEVVGEDAMMEVKKQRPSTEEEDTKNVNRFVMTVMEDDKECKTESDLKDVKNEHIPVVSQDAASTVVPLPSPTTSSPAIAASSSPTAALPEIKIPKKRGRKPGFKKLLNPAATAAVKKSARVTRDQDHDPAFGPTSSKPSEAMSNPTTRLSSRRIKPTAKMLANEEMRFGFVLSSNARLSLSSENLDAERSPVKDEPSPQFVARRSAPCSKEASPSEAVSSDVEERRASKQKTKPTYMVVIPPRRRAPCPDPMEFLNAIKQEKINLNRSPEDNKKMNQKQRKRMLKLKEKHFNKLGLQRTRVNQPGSSHDSSDGDEAEEEFVPNKKVTVGKPNVTLRLRANTITDRPPSLDPIRATPAKRRKSRTHEAHPTTKKRSYTVIKSNHHETSLILSTKHKASSGTIADRPQATPPPASKPVENDKTNCLCTKPSKYFTKRTNETMYCRAMDEIAGNLIGCCNEVPGDDLINLLRPSVRVKYSIFCAGHMSRLQAHTSCAGCGIFCTQGRFIMCQRNHLFHRDCATKFILNTPYRSDAEFMCPTLVLRCPHCGIDAPEKETQISMKCRSIPVYSPYQEKLTKVAKMSIGKHTFASSAAGPRTGQLRQFQWELEKLIPANVMEVILRPQEPGHTRVEFNQKDVIHAMRTDNVNRMAEIIASGYDINSPLTDFARGTCLHLVASYGSLSMAYLLLSRSPSIDYINRFDRELKSAVMCSVFNTKNDILRLLVQCGADVTLRGYGGMTALHMAAKANNFAATQIILESYRRSTSAHRFGLLVNAVDDGGWTTIVWAAELGYSDIVTYLVQCGANLSICDAQKNTVLHWAALSDDVATVRPLLADADLNVQNMNGDTPLHIACRNSNTRMCLLFLAHGACLELQNDQAEKPFDGIGDENSVCAKAVMYNQKLRELARFGEHAIVCQDISKGREAYPIKVIKRRQQRSNSSPANDDDIIDDDEVPHFIYITQSIILQSNIQIDRRISKMRICACVDNCTTSCCQCSEISVQNWYNSEGRLNGDFNFADPAMIFECNDVCGCNKMQCMNRVVQNGQKTALQVVEFGGSKGWGVTTVADIARGTFVAEYTGEILTDLEAERRTDDSYFFDLDASEHCIDAHYYGNVSRFFNHSCAPNLVPIRVYYDHQDLRFPKIAFFAARDIEANEEITFDYGDKFWLTKYKSFSCECRNSKCRFPASTVNASEAQLRTQRITSATTNGDSTSMV